MAYNRRGYGMGPHRGDPFIGGLIKGVGKLGGGILKTVGGVVGGPIGGVLSGVGGIIAPTRAPVLRSQALPPIESVSGSVGFPGGFGFGGSASFGPSRGSAAAAPMMVGGGMTCPSGYHPNKSDYFLKDGSFVAKGTRCVRNRSRNPANPRALRRSISRIDGFGRLVQRSRKVVKAAARRVD